MLYFLSDKDSAIEGLGRLVEKVGPSKSHININYIQNGMHEGYKSCTKQDVTKATTSRNKTDTHLLRAS
jgi:hypothetical protein